MGAVEPDAEQPSIVPAQVCVSPVRPVIGDCGGKRVFAQVERDRMFAAIEKMKFTAPASSLTSASVRVDSVPVGERGGLPVRLVARAAVEGAVDAEFRKGVMLSDMVSSTAKPLRVEVFGGCARLTRCLCGEGFAGISIDWLQKQASRRDHRFC